MSIKRISRDYIPIIIILSFFINTVVHIVLYLNDGETLDLVMFFVCLIALMAYLIIILVTNTNQPNQYIVYDDYFYFNGNNIIDSNYTTKVDEKITEIYQKYHFQGNQIFSYLYEDNEYQIHFDLIKIDSNRKLCMFKRMNEFNTDTDKKYVYMDLKMNQQHYFTNHEIKDLDELYVRYMSKRNALAVVKEKNSFKIVKYRYYIKQRISNLNTINNDMGYWSVIPYLKRIELSFETLDDAICYLNSLSRKAYRTTFR